jgi:hypothetical protein
MCRREGPKFRIAGDGEDGSINHDRPCLARVVGAQVGDKVRDAHGEGLDVDGMGSGIGHGSEIVHQSAPASGRTTRAQSAHQRQPWT